MRTNKPGIDGPSIRDGVLHREFRDVRHFDVPDMKVWRIKAWIAFHKEVGLRRVGTGRHALLRLPQACANDRVVLKISPYARQVRHGLDAKTRKLGLIPDAGKHQNLRRLDGSGRKYDFAGCLDRAYLAAPVELNSCDRRAVHCKLPDQGARQDGEVGLVHHGIQIVGWNIKPPSSANTKVRQSAATWAFLEDSVLVCKDWNPQRFRRSEEGRRQRIGV